MNKIVTLHAAHARLGDVMVLVLPERRWWRLFFARLSRRPAPMRMKRVVVTALVSATSVEVE